MKARAGLRGNTFGVRVRAAIAASLLVALILAAAAGAVLAADPTGADPDGTPALVPDPLGPLPPDDPESVAYAQGYYILYVVNIVFTLGLLYAILASGLAAAMQRFTERTFARRGLQIALFVVLLTFLRYGAGLPIDLWVYFREERYGFMNQSLAAWFGDRGKAIGISTALQALFFPMLYVAIRRLGHRWWLAGAALAILFVVVGMVIAPVFFAPLFNTFTPLSDDALRADLLALAHAQGIPADEVYEVDASRQSEHVNAYVAGMLGTERIVLYDTLLRHFAPREIRAVMGHEMGHYVLDHVWKTVALIGALIVAALWAVDRLGRRILRARPRWGIAGLEAPASLPLILLLVFGMSVVARPGINAWSRAQEAAADEFGMNAVRDPEGAASAFRKFALLDLDEVHVHPVVEVLLFTHPSIARRVEHARAWAREHPRDGP